MDNRTIKVKILESWYIIDSVLFGDHSRNVVKENATFREYASLKGALLSNLFEYYTHIKYTPVYESVPHGVKQLTIAARDSARYSKKLASNILQQEAVKEAIKRRVIRESKDRKIENVETFTDSLITEKFIQIALDNALIGVPVLEARSIKNTEDFRGQILEDTYKMMRNSLIDLSRKCTKI